jgi:hypothetical protein
MLGLLMGGIYEVHRWDGLKCYDIDTKSHEDIQRLFGGDFFIIRNYAKKTCCPNCSAEFSALDRQTSMRSLKRRVVEQRGPP